MSDNLQLRNHIAIKMVRLGLCANDVYFDIPWGTMVLEIKL